MAVEENKAQGKQAKDKSVFFWFGDDLTVDDNPQRATAACHKIRQKSAQSHFAVAGKSAFYGCWGVGEIFSGLGLGIGFSLGFAALDKRKHKSIG